MSLRLWDQHAVPRLADLLLRGHPVGELRRQACAELVGRVVEIGFGSGLNVRWYPTSVTGVSAVEPSDVAWRLSERRRQGSSVPIRRSGLDGQHLDLADASHDHGLVTFSLCTIPDPVLALREVKRVLRPGGRLHFLEHGLAPDARVRRRQRRLDPLQRALGGGCHLTRDPSSLLTAASWEVEWLKQGYVPGPSLGHPWTYVSWGVAR